MRIKLVAAITAIAGLTSVASCHWFSSTPADRSSFKIEGKWKMDSVYSPDTSALPKGLLASAFTIKDPAQPGFQFNADSTFTELMPKDSVVRKYAVKDNKLLLQEDSILTPYAFEVLSDTAFRLYKDSIYIVLKRQ